MVNLENVDLIDLFDAVCLAKSDLDWTLYALHEIKEKVKALKEKQLITVCMRLTFIT
ncbi:hypothetical protein [Acinetobacter baumannii]|uniref:hypothetical protein n=1 Tax=Acinetobacter baumannii TaxID=470 RepID=UPI0022B44E54|nr:hypothetical protein [Acinetobacter baumannii]MCZ6920278.1 hypothetical protein [Acinetobacter baumannii]